MGYERQARCLCHFQYGEVAFDAVFRRDLLAEWARDPNTHRFAVQALCERCRRAFAAVRHRAHHALDWCRLRGVRPLPRPCLPLWKTNCL